MINFNGFFADNKRSLQNINGFDTKQQKINGFDIKQQKTNSEGIVGKMTAIFNNSRSCKNSSLTNSPLANKKYEFSKKTMSKSFNEKIECNNELFNNNKKLKNGTSTLSNMSLYDYGKPVSDTEFSTHHSRTIIQPFEIKKNVPETSSTNGTLTDDDISYCSASSNSINNTLPNNLLHFSTNLNLVKTTFETNKSLSNCQSNNELLNGFDKKNDLSKLTNDTENNSKLLNLYNDENNLVNLTFPKINNSIVNDKSTKQNINGIF